MRPRLSIALLACALALPALAQEQGAGGGGRRGGPPGGGGQGRGGMNPAEMATRLAEQLGLTAEQKPKYDAIVEKFRPKWDAQTADREKMRDLMQKLRDARQSGDQAKVDEYQKQFDEMREKSRAVMDEFYKEVEPILTPEQKTKLADFRAQGERMRGGGGLDALLNRLPDELKLTAEQKTKYDALAAKARSQIQELTPLQQELRRARRDNNTARITELEKQIADKGGEPTADAFLAQVEPILTDEQKAKLPDIWAQSAPPMNPDDVRTVIQAAKRLQLTPEQQTKLQAMTRDAMQASRTTTTPEKRAELAKSTKAKITAILDATQKTEFERSLERRPGPPGGGGAGGGGGGAGGGGGGAGR